MEWNYQIKKIEKSDWFIEIKKRKKMTYDELMDKLDYISENHEELELLFDFLEKNNVHIFTNNQLKSKEYHLHKKRKILLHSYDKNDRLSLFLKPYDHVALLSEEEIDNKIKEIKKIEEELITTFNSSFYRLYYLYQFYGSLTSSNYEEFKKNFNPNFIIAQVLFEKQNEAFQKWYVKQWDLCEELYKHMKSGKYDEGNQTRRTLLENINSLNWKNERTKELIKEFLKEKHFSLFKENKEEIYSYLYNFIKDKQKDCLSLFERMNLMKERIIQSEMKLVISIALKYTSSGIELRDLIQEGNKGLIEALNSYEISSGKNFQQFLTKHIRESINNYIYMNNNSLAIPITKRDTVKKILKTIDKLSQELQRMPKHEEIAAKLSIPSESVLKILTGIKKESSWDQQVNQYKTEFYYQTQENPENINSLPKELDEKRKLLEKMKEILSDREEKILRLLYGYYGIHYSHSEISKIFEISEKRIKKIEEIAREKLKESQQNIITLCYVILP